MNNYNQPPVLPSIELKEIVKNTLNLTEAALINVFNQFDNHCFETLNAEVGVALCHYKVEDFCGYFSAHNEMTQESIVDIYGGQLPVSDFVGFINEVRV